MNDEVPVELPGDCYIVIFDASTSSIRGAELNINGDVAQIAGIEGQALGCLQVRVSLSGVDASDVTVTVDPNTNLWKADIELSNPADLCGKQIIINAACADDGSACANSTTIWQLPCAICPEVLPAVDPEGQCDGNLRNVVFVIDFIPPLPEGADVTVFWAFANGINNTEVEIGRSHHKRLYTSKYIGIFCRGTYSTSNG